MAKIAPPWANNVPDGYVKPGEGRPPGVPPWANAWHDAGETAALLGRDAPPAEKAKRVNAPPPKKHKLKTRRSAKRRHQAVVDETQGKTDTGIDTEPEESTDQHVCGKCNEGFPERKLLRGHQLNCKAGV